MPIPIQNPMKHKTKVTYRGPLAKGAASTTVDISNADDVADAADLTDDEAGAKPAAAERSVAKVTIESFILILIL